MKGKLTASRGTVRMHGQALATSSWPEPGLPRMRAGRCGKRIAQKTKLGSQPHKALS